LTADKAAGAGRKSLERKPAKPPEKPKSRISAARVCVVMGFFVCISLNIVTALDFIEQRGTEFVYRNVPAAAKKRIRLIYEEPVWIGAADHLA